ncbi:MAG: MarR family winged helix-turn-helix transcriptional regulator [Panacagrimonas sp.]
MKTIERLNAIEASAESWRKSMAGIAPEDVSLMRLIRVASLGITAFVDPMLRDSRLTESSYHSLIVIVASGGKGITVTALCDQVGQARANMTRILKLLASMDLILMRADSGDSRRKRVIATDKGNRLIRTLSKRLSPIVRLAFSGVSAEQKQSLHQLLGKLIASASMAETEALKFS